MKTAKSTSFVLLLLASITSSSIQVMAQQNQNKQAGIFENVDRINGNDVIEKLSSKQNVLNKAGKNGSLPKAEYIFNRRNLTIFTFNGLDYYVKNNAVVGIQGLDLPENVLDQITEKLVLLDSVQYSYTARAITEYYNGDADVQKIRAINRLFQAALKILSSTTRDIASLTKTENPSLNVQNNIAKMRLPNVDKALENQATQTLVQLYK